MNAASITDTYTLPCMENCIDSLKKAKLFTVLDALRGDWPVQFEGEGKDKKTATCHLSTYRHTLIVFS